MNVFKLQLLLFLNILYVSDSERRIQGGYPVVSEKRYMVYLVKAPKSEKKFDQWLCGGALVTTWFILTSQSCVQDVEYIYAIAGYNKYVTDDQIETDPCTKYKKKKVVFFCFPEGADLNTDNATGWAVLDIALAKVESEYDPRDDSFKVSCSYIPTVIPINYEVRFQRPGTDAIVLGYGHTDDWRMPFDETNFNQKLLRYARVELGEEKLCKVNYPKFADAIEKCKMVCSIEEGDIDETGKLDIKSPSPRLNGCNAGLRTDNCTDEDFISRLLDFGSVETLKSPTDEMRTNSSFGFCQNDHGGPLVTWVGSKEVLIGIATIFKVSDRSKCEGPYLYTSTASHGDFLHCVLTKGPKTRRGLCESPTIGRSFNIIEKYISWDDYPDGENEFTSNKQTNKTKVSKAFKELMKLEKFWKEYNSRTNGTTTVAREI